MNISVWRRKYLMALTLAVFAVPQLASAGPLYDQTQLSTVSVQIDDLNLESSAGLNALYQRLAGASRAVCGDYSDLKRVGSLKQLRNNKTCYDETMAQALAEVNYPNLAQASR